jgi:hypothetical protein
MRLLFTKNFAEQKYWLLLNEVLPSQKWQLPLLLTFEESVHESVSAPLMLLCAP